jgi:hypothetical protein
MIVFYSVQYDCHRPVPYPRNSEVEEEILLKMEFPYIFKNTFHIAYMAI